MSRYFFLACFIFAIMTGLTTQAQTSEALFASGVKAMQKNDLKLARESFQNSLKIDPRQTQSYYNWGWVEFKTQRTGLAIGLWRKALDIDPQNAQAQVALSFAEKKLEHSQIAHETEVWESLRSHFLIFISLISLLILTNLFLLLSGWLWVKYWGRRKKALSDETALPSIPVIASLLSLGFILTLALSIAKIIDLQTPRGTVVPKQLSARTTPDANGTVLFDLYEGLEVVIQQSLRQSSANWFQVTYPGGMSGWVPSEAIFVSAGRAP